MKHLHRRMTVEDKKQIIRLWLEGKTTREIGKALGLGIPQISVAMCAMRKNGIKIPNRQSVRDEKTVLREYLADLLKGGNKRRGRPRKLNLVTSSQDPQIHATGTMG